MGKRAGSAAAKLGSPRTQRRRFEEAAKSEPEVRAFIETHPEFAPGFQPHKDKRPRNAQGGRLRTIPVDPMSLDGYGEDDNAPPVMVSDVSQRHSSHHGVARYRPLVASPLRSAEDAALDRVEPEPGAGTHDGLCDYFGPLFARLPKEYCEVLTWTFFDGLSQRAIAQRRQPQVKQSTVNRQLYRASAAVVDAIASEEGPLPYIYTGGRPKKDRDAIVEMAIRVLRGRGLLQTRSPFDKPSD